MNDKLLTIQETADLLKVHYQTVRNYIDGGKLPASKIGKTVRIRLSDVEKLLSNESKDDELRELEIRFLTDRRKEIEKHLVENDAEIIYHGHVIDHWYTPNHVKNAEQKDDFYESGEGFGVRIREQDNGYTGKITTSLEIKRLVTPYHHEHCIEQELDISDYKEAARMLNLMNFKEFITIDKDRLIYKYQELKVVIDDIKNFGTGIELEIMTEKNRDEVWPQLEKVAHEIGLDVKKELLEKSVTYLVMQEMAKY